MTEPAEFRVIWKDQTGDRWDGYYESPAVCWGENGTEQTIAFHQQSHFVANTDVAKEIAKINDQKPDINEDGLPDRFGLEYEEDSSRALTKFYRGVVRESSRGCGGQFTINKSQGFEPQGRVLTSILRDEVFGRNEKTITREYRNVELKRDDKRNYTLVIQATTDREGMDGYSLSTWTFTGFQCAEPVVTDLRAVGGSLGCVQ